MSRAPKLLNPYSSWSSLFGATVRRLRLGMRAGRPLTQAELEDKFTACAGRVLDKQAVDGALTMLNGLESLADVPLAELLERF